MEELQALQKKFMEIQKSGGGFKLSERIVVDIIQKILDRKKVKLVFTTNGKEYVAEEKITKEILDEVKKSQGRISKIELIKLLDVTANIIDSKIKDLLTRDRSLNFIEGSLITNYYLDNMCSEINELLKYSGCITVSDLSTRFDVSIDFIKRFVKERIGTSINGKLFETRLLTEDYVEKQKQRIRPILIASTTPIQLSYMIENYQIDELIVESLVKNLIDSGIIKGKLSSNVFEPAIYAESQFSYLKGVLLQNNCIEYSKLKNIGINKNEKVYIKEFLMKTKSFEDGIFLSEFFITSTLKNNFEYVFLDNLSKNIATNLSSVFYFELTEEDVMILLDSINYKSKSVHIINMNLIPTSIVSNFIEETGAKLKEEASLQYNNHITKMKEKELAIKKAETEKETKDKKGKKGKKGKNTNEDEEADQSSPTSLDLTQEFKKKIQTIFFNLPNFEDLNDKHDTLSQLFEVYTLPSLRQSYSQYINEFIKSKSKNANDPKTLMNQIEGEFFELSLLQKSIDLLNNFSSDSSYKSNLNAIIAHICKKFLSNLFKDIITYQMIHMKMKIDMAQLNDPNQRKEILKNFQDEDIKQIFSLLADHLQNRNLTNFIETLKENCKNLAISLASVDKKKEKSIIEKYQSELFSRIDQNFILIGKMNKKDYISLAVDMCLSALLKSGIYMKLPYENWSLPILQAIFTTQNNKNLIKSINMIVELLKVNEADIDGKQEEIAEAFKNLFNSY